MYLDRVKGSHLNTRASFISGILLYINNYVVFYYAWFSLLAFTSNASSNARRFPRYESKLLESARFKPTNACFWLNSFPSSPTKPLFVIPIPITLSICIIITLTPPGSNYAAHERSGVLGQIQPGGGVKAPLFKDPRWGGPAAPGGLPAEVPAEAAPAALLPG